MVDRTALYTELGLTPGADHAAVRTAYRTLARKLHPDVNRSADAAERMRNLNAAYDALRTLPVGTPAPDTSAPSTAPAAAPSASTRSAAPFGGFAYRVAGASGSAVSLGTPLFVPFNGVTIGIVAGFVGLVTLLAVWALSVARPFAGAPVAAPSARVVAPVVQSTSSTNSLAAQASANAAANAAAARNNLTVGTTSTSAPSAPTTVSAPALAPPASAVPPLAVQSTTQATDASAVPASQTETHTQPPVHTQTITQSQPQTRSVQPSLPAVPATQPNAGQPVNAAGSPPFTGGDAALTQAATRALSAYDKAWTAYATTLRVAAAGSPMSSAATTINAVNAPSGAARVAGLSPSALLSGEAQLTLARTAHFQAQLAWNTQSSASLTAAVSAAPNTPRPDPAKAVRADQRLRQAADLISQAGAAGTPLNISQLKSLLDESEQLHRESVAEWAKLLGALG